MARLGHSAWAGQQAQGPLPLATFSEEPSPPTHFLRDHLLQFIFQALVGNYLLFYPFKKQFYLPESNFPSLVGNSDSVSPVFSDFLPTLSLYYLISR